MNCCSHCGKSVGHNSSGDQNQCMCGTVGGTSVDGLEDAFNESFHIHEVENATTVCTSPSDGDYITHKGEGTTMLEAQESESMSVVAQKCLCKSETFPAAKLSPLEEEEDGGSELQADSCIKRSSTLYARSISLPTPSRLVSAMKGSREKQGVEPKKLTVTWAPDVYDPPPTSLSHVVKGGSQKRSKKNKKNGKNKQKGKSLSRGSSYKDKKQMQKLSRNLCFESPEARDRFSGNSFFESPDARERLVFDNRTDYGKVADIDVGSPEPHCGSSFLKKSLSKVHMSVAEAL